MRKVLWTIGIFVVLSMVTGIVFAEPQQQGMPGHGPGRMSRPTPAERVQRLGQRLQLSDDQKSKIQPLFESEMEQVKAIHQDQSLSRQQKMEKVREIRQATHDKIMPILTPDQQKKLQEMMEKAKQRREQRMKEGSGAQPPQSQEQE